MHIKEFADLTGVSVRTLHYYDEIGLLEPAFVDASTGYRFYDKSSVFRMQEILFYRELDFSLKSIQEILSSPHYDKESALREQKKLLTLKKERLERLVLAVDEAMKGENVMSKFDNSEYENYKAEVKEKWGATDAYKEYEEKANNYSAQNQNELAKGLDTIIAAFAAYMKRGSSPDSAETQRLVKKLQGYITAHFYTCTNEILLGLGQMYVADERFKNNIDRHADGTSEYIRSAIDVYAK